MSREKTDEAMRAAVLALKASTDWSSSEISAVLGLSVRQINRVYSRAIEAGFNPSARPLRITNALVSDRPRSGRPKKWTDEAKEAVAAKVKRDRYGQEKSYAEIAEEMTQEGHPISAMTVWRVLKEARSLVPEDQAN